MSSTKAVKPAEPGEQFEEPKLKLSEKIALVIGSTPSTFHYQMVQMYLLFFYTDFMKINPAYVAVLFLVIRIINAVATPFLGALIDKAKIPWGKYTPWFVIFGIPFGIAGWLTFTDPGLSPAGNLVYAVMTYTIYSILSAVVSLPGGAVIPAVTKRVDERVSLGQFGYLFTFAGALIVSIGAVPLYKALGNGNDARGFSLLMAVAAVVTVLIAVYQSCRIKERYIVGSKKDEKSPSSPSFKQMFAATFTNKAAIILYVSLFGSTLSAGVRSAVQIHFFKYFFNNEVLMSVMGVIAIVPSILGIALSQMVIKRLGLKKTILAGIVMNIIACPILLFIPANNTGLVIFLAFTVISVLIGSLSGPASGALMPAAIDYTEWKTGLNINAFMTSINGTIKTFGTALSGSIAAVALTMIGYVPGIEQSASTLFGLKIIVFVLPVILGALGLSILWFDLTEEKQKQIAKDLEARRKNADSA
ncbi:MFS transporter [Paenibacillus macerans]|uniref:MFS transporter n=1 Tax=Paenibacillus macerans TaxID=44252 RepID=UPI00203C8E5C|nr:glycoside-pentoside-hexuronide (GPH):cation symporter [Paenibacillus macerans]MCM3703990.1 glycoside-pentoside-hexuronide (GPH):cation symporter [Paenibacillus macerans]